MSGCSACGWGAQDCFFANCMHPDGPDNTRKAMDSPKHLRHKPVLETELWCVVMLKDGKPIGFHKVASGKFHGTLDDAEATWHRLPAEIRPSYAIRRVLAHFQEVDDE